MAEPQSWARVARSLGAADSARFRAILDLSARLQRERRARVLRHPDLAARLCVPPCGYARADQWTGYIPPGTGQEQVPELLHSGSPIGIAGRSNAGGLHTGPTELNGSGFRAALVEIAAEAWARDVAAGLEAGPAEADAIELLPFPVPRAIAPPPEPAQGMLEQGWPAGTVGEQVNP